MDIQYIIMLAVFGCIFATPLGLYMKVNRKRWIKEGLELIYGDPELKATKLVEVQPKKRGGKQPKINPEQKGPKLKGKLGAPRNKAGSPTSKSMMTQNIAGPTVQYISQTPGGGNAPQVT